MSLEMADGRRLMPTGTKYPCAQRLINQIRSRSGHSELHFVCEQCQDGQCRYANPDPSKEENTARHVEIFRMAAELGFPVAGILNAAEMAIKPIAGNENLRTSVALAIVGFAMNVQIRERDRAQEERNAGAPPDSDAGKIIDAERRRIVRAMSGLFSGEFREIVIKQCGLGT